MKEMSIRVSALFAAIFMMHLTGVVFQCRCVAEANDPSWNQISALQAYAIASSFLVDGGYLEEDVVSSCPYIWCAFSNSTRIFESGQEISSPNGYWVFQFTHAWKGYTPHIYLDGVSGQVLSWGMTVHADDQPYITYQNAYPAEDMMDWESARQLAWEWIRSQYSIQEQADEDLEETEESIAFVEFCDSDGQSYLTWKVYVGFCRKRPRPSDANYGIIPYGEKRRECVIYVSADRQVIIDGHIDLYMLVEKEGEPVYEVQDEIVYDAH